MIASVTYLLACVRACAASSNHALRRLPSGEGKGSNKVGSGLRPNFTRRQRGREPANVAACVGRGSALFKGHGSEEWCHKDYPYHQDRSAVFCGPFRAWHRAAQTENCCKAAFWRRPPLPIQVISRNVAFLCSLSDVRALLRSRRCSKKRRPPQNAPYLPWLLTKTIPLACSTYVRT